MIDPALTRLAVTGVIVLIIILAYPTQLLLSLSPVSSAIFNGFVLITWLTYYRAITTPAGSPPRTWTPTTSSAALEGGSTPPSDQTTAPLLEAASTNLPIYAGTPRFCTACDAFKPPRAHHCRTCATCILKMDHHCPWTANCVGYANHGHFLRFVSYATGSLWLLLYHLGGEWLKVYHARELPDYLSPHTFWGLVALMGASVPGSVVGIALGILWIRSVMNAAEGVTTIETWEKERHDARVRLRKERRVVFPFDIGIYENLVIGFGYVRNPLAWMWPFAKTPRVAHEVKMFESDQTLLAGLEWEVNGFEDRDVIWPPGGRDGEGGWDRCNCEEDDDEDGEWRGRNYEMGSAWTVNNPTDVGEFRKRQYKDMERWKNSEGETLKDFGVDEQVEEEDIPLAELLRRRKAQ